jgi:autotransporter-associated beta strand protein
MLLPALLAGGSALGATYDWAGGSGTWDTTSPSWSGPGTTWPAAGLDNDAVFGVLGGTVTIAGAIGVDDVAFTAPGYRIDGGALTLMAPSLVSVGADLRATIACEIQGGAGITVAGPGTLSVRGASSYTGSTTVSAGTLMVTGSGRIYSGVAPPAGAVVRVNAGATLELDTWWVGDDESLGRLPVDAARIVVDGGTVRVNLETGSGRGVTVTAKGATLEAAAGADWLLHGFGDDDDFVYNGNPSLVFTGAGTGRFDKPFSGTGSVIKRGPGKWTLGRTNAYTGDTVIEEGVLGVARASLDDGATVSIAAGALMSLEFFGGDAIGSLVLDGVTMPAGTYGPRTHPRYFAGWGTLVVGGPSTEGPFAFTYGLSGGSEGWPADRRSEIVSSMEGAVAHYNRHGFFPKHVTANYSPGTPTADANYDGWINFGGSRNFRVALHEIGHTMGVGTHGNWPNVLQGGGWTGAQALKLVRQIDGPAAGISGDAQHFWPYGLNFDNESSADSDQIHVRIVSALRRDMGIGNAVPSVSLIVHQFTPVGEATGPIPFTVADDDSPDGSLAVMASTSDPDLVPQDSIRLGGSGADRTVTIAPSPGRAGIATITLWVSDGLDATSRSFLLGVGTIVAPLTSGANDAEESAAGEVNLASSDLELTNDDPSGAGNQIVGLRFSNLQIPAGASIAGAWIQFTTDEAGSAPAALEIRVQAADDAAPFEETVLNLSGRPRAPVQVAWEPAPWNTEREASPEQRTPDLSTLVQAVVDRPGWESGSHIAFLIGGTGRRTAQAHDKPNGAPARLIVRLASSEAFRRGDSNADGKLDIADAIATLGYLFLGGA